MRWGEKEKIEWERSLTEWTSKDVAMKKLKIKKSVNIKSTSQRVNEAL